MEYSWNTAFHGPGFLQNNQGRQTALLPKFNGGAVILQLLSFGCLQVIKPDNRYAIEDYVHWGISFVTGAWVGLRGTLMSSNLLLKLTA